MRLTVLTAVMALAGCAAMPGDVTAFMKRRDMCDHFHGEDAYDAERGQFLAAQMQAACEGTDAALAGLRARYEGRPDIRRALAGYEDRVE